MARPLPPASKRRARSGERAGTNGMAGSMLAALRIAAMAVTLLACLPLHGVAALVMTGDRHNPVPSWFLRAIAAICGLHVRIIGTRPARGTFFLANHVSWLDIPALAGVTGTAFIAHDGLAAIGPLRRLCELNDTVFIARHDRGSVGRQVAQVRGALGRTGGLAIFPEGTTSDGTGLLPFKSSLLAALEGALDAQGRTIPIQPVWLDYGPQSATVCWVGDDPGLANALRMLGRWRPIELTVHFLPVLDDAARASRKTIAAAAHDAILTAMEKTRA